MDFLLGKLMLNIEEFDVSEQKIRFCTYRDKIKDLTGRERPEKETANELYC
jgi:hypothetical protein